MFTLIHFFSETSLVFCKSNGSRKYSENSVNKSDTPTIVPYIVVPKIFLTSNSDIKLKKTEFPENRYKNLHYLDIIYSFGNV